MDFSFISPVCLGASFFLYLASFAAQVLSFRASGQNTYEKARRLMQAGFWISTLYFLSESLRLERFLPVAQLAQALAFFAWSIAFVYLVLLARIRCDSFGMVLAPILALLTGAAALAFSPEPSGFSGELDIFFAVHIVSAFFAYACFTIAFAAGVLYLIQQHELKTHKAGTFYHRLPALEALEKLIFQPMALGAILLAAAILVGFFWSRLQFGEYWLTDPKTISTMLVIIFYSTILYFHYIVLLRGKRLVVLNLLAFGFVLVTFVGLRFVEGSHNFIQ